MSKYLGQIEEAVRAVQIHPPLVYSWFGRRSPRPVPSIRRLLSPRMERNYLLMGLQAQLYSHFYCLGGAAATRDEAPRNRGTGVGPFVEQLMAANSGSGFWEPGWEVRSIEEGVVAAWKAGLELRAWPGEFLEDGETEYTLAQGSRVSLRHTADLLGATPGFYMAVGNVDLGSGVPVVRFYWNVTADGAASLMRAVTGPLNAEMVPFRFKVASDPGRFARTDSAVLYVPVERYEQVASIVAAVYQEVKHRLKRGVPALTKELAPGLGLAEDPGGNESFGQHRCRILAEGIVRAHEQGKLDLQARIQCVTECFAEQGLNIEAPYLNEGSEDKYSFKWQETMATARGWSEASVERGPSGVTNEVLIQAAAEMATRLASEAIWYEGRCNWVGNRKQHRPHARAEVYQALGPDLYSGSAGIALFLADAFAATGDTEIGRAAVGGMRRSLERAEDIAPVVRLGLYVGWVGLAYAAARVARATGEDGLLEDAREMLRRGSVSDGETEYAHDLLSGRAGGIIGALALREPLEKPWAIEVAARWGEDLLNIANRNEDACSWESVGFRAHRDLTGFSHGAAGIGLALLELWRATGENRYREAAQQAFEYEAGCFDPEEANWPDFRHAPPRGQARYPFPVFWCHGAPGIALSRLRAYEVLRDERYRVEAVAGLETTLRTVEAALEAGAEDFELCHGLAGNAEVLLLGQEALGTEWTSGQRAADIALMVGERISASMGVHQQPWEAGGAFSPALMTGLAGAGYFCLRLAKASSTSILLVRDAPVTSTEAVGTTAG